MNTNMATTATTGNSSRGCSCSFGQAKPRALQGELVISGDWHQCLVVQELMACCSRTYGFEEFAVRKAVKEALANAFRHGNGRAPDKCIRVEYKMDETEFQVSITDEGIGFDHKAAQLGRPDQTSTGHGLGLMRHYMTDVHFNSLGNRVFLTKRKEPAVNEWSLTDSCRAIPVWD